MPITAKTQSSSVVEHAFCPTKSKLTNLNNDTAIKFSHRCCQTPKHFQESCSQKKQLQENHHRALSNRVIPSRILPTKFALSNLPRSQTGFTLVEIMVVMVILSIFAGMIAVSVGSSESRKNRAFYEHLTDSLSYVRLLAAERMQPMGLSLQADKQGQVTPVIMSLSNPYISYQTQSVTPSNGDSTPKNSMELSADLSGMSGANGESQPTPSWELESEVTLPEMPAGVSLSIQSLQANNASGLESTQTLQPWFNGQAVPQVLWFGTGQATPVTIEVRHQSRLVGEVITIMPDGSMTIGQGL
ncbi:prepilin-type N-terminal cleavage/methylation domain-containing protein [Psychrobacter sp. P11G5]|uniref:pilus assembly FimT family protein n=1 Tax=Psychrobacter sp. P11G5 TaxID=1699624 RepID=UPI0009EF155E|nr:prepilin-type N-terminal cleavage/methylation domain-containing protein [Psychrobacter sp. P11G5]